MTPEELKARARRFPDEVLTQGDLAVIDDLFAATCRYHLPDPLNGCSGSIKRWVTSLRRAFPDLSATVEGEVAESGTIVQRLTLSGTHAGAYLGISPTGERATWELMVTERAGPDDRFAEVRILVDHLTLLTQLGAIPATLVATQDTAPNGETTT